MRAKRINLSKLLQLKWSIHASTKWKRFHWKTKTWRRARHPKAKKQPRLKKLNLYSKLHWIRLSNSLLNNSVTNKHAGESSQNCSSTESDSSVVCKSKFTFFSPNFEHLTDHLSNSCFRAVNDFKIDLDMVQFGHSCGPLTVAFTNISQRIRQIELKLLTPSSQMAVVEAT